MKAVKAVSCTRLMDQLCFTAAAHRKDFNIIPLSTPHSKSPSLQLTFFTTRTTCSCKRASRPHRRFNSLSGTRSSLSQRMRLALCFLGESNEFIFGRSFFHLLSFFPSTRLVFIFCCFFHSVPPILLGGHDNNRKESHPAHQVAIPITALQCHSERIVCVQNHQGCVPLLPLSQFSFHLSFLL